VGVDAEGKNRMNNHILIEILYGLVKILFAVVAVMAFTIGKLGVRVRKLENRVIYFGDRTEQVVSFTSKPVEKPTTCTNAGSDL
jgi:hypothetical protein